MIEHRRRILRRFSSREQGLEMVRSMARVEIEVPDGIIEFLKQLPEYDEADIGKYLEEAVQHHFGADWNAFARDADVFLDLETLIEKFNLRSTPILADYIKTAETA